MIPDQNRVRRLRPGSAYTKLRTRLNYLSAFGTELSPEVRYRRIGTSHGYLKLLRENPNLQHTDTELESYVGKDVYLDIDRDGYVVGLELAE